METAVHNYFGFNSFLPGQLDAMLPAMHGKDVFVRLATGSGKTLCMFMVPLATSSLATGLIISPLIGLMEQQVHACATSYQYLLELLIKIDSKVHQLTEVGVSAIRVYDKSQIPDVASGKFRFGGSTM